MSVPEFYGDFINSERWLAKLIFRYTLKVLSLAAKKIGYNIDILKQTVCMVVNSVMVDHG